MKRTGRILWWSKRDENGIIVDGQGNEFYFDRSVFASFDRSAPLAGLAVKYSICTLTKDCLCARDIQILSKTRSAQSQADTSEVIQFEASND
ncbi:MAG: hypothetical protein EOP04_24700 [Proteobacteria bacterium]|nr:MAG: hypothetical protein EOP04_24700 [Pseudomonadota bacterium]